MNEGRRSEWGAGGNISPLEMQTKRWGFICRGLPSEPSYLATKGNDDSPEQ